MAYIDADLPVDNSKLPELEILGKNVQVEEDKGILYISKNDITIELTGVFKEDKNGVIHGKVTALVCKTGDDEPTWDIGNMSYDFDQLFIKIGDGKLHKVIQQIFEKKDTIWGSHFDDKLYGFDGNDEVNGWRGNDVLYGGNGKDELIGQIGDDRLNGGPGKDVLKGGADSDTFVFDQKLKSSNVDKINIFDVGRDSIELKKSIFSGFDKGELSSDQFKFGNHASGDKAQILYNSSKGHLFYDPDGAGEADPLKFASAPKHKDLSHDDFFVA
jgi:Ca2+-binding RTX toxin-like protein